MTYNSLQVQYESLVDMVPSLTEEEKSRFMPGIKRLGNFDGCREL